MELSVYFLYLFICVSAIYGQSVDVVPAHCEGIACSPPNCVDTYVVEGECCPVCAGPGRSCMHHGRSYKDGESFKQECNTCTCTDGNVACTKEKCPGSKPGRCPRPDGVGVDAGVGVCVDMCTNDESCPRRQKCCSNGCGRTCQRPVKGKSCTHKGNTYQDGDSFKDECNTCTCENGIAGCTLKACPGKPGTCPIPVGGGICVETCTSDYSCPLVEKCCSNGCGQTCMKPIDGGRQCEHKGLTYQDGESFKDECNNCTCTDGKAVCTLMACPDRPGRCPKPVGVGGVDSICVDTCTTDYSCPVGEKCCSNGCGKTCMKSIDGMTCVHKGVTYTDGERFNDECNTCTCVNGVAECTQKACPDRPGRCPKPVGIGGTSICLDTCTSDYSCPIGEKCCLNGCGKICMKPIDGMTCVYKGVTYTDGERFNDECNTCRCVNGVAECTKKACPGKPGRCPKPIELGGGVCVDTCTDDYSCASGEKCCNNGYCNNCMIAIDGGRTCEHKGVIYLDGDSFKDKCNTCTCANGIASCTEMACPGVPGRCPEPIPLVGGVCVDTCTDDYSCPTLEKCCSNGNCRTCMKPVPGGRTCVHKGRTYQDGESFMDDCNTCNCNNGNAGCTRMACPGRPGTCPKLLGAGASVCVDSCDSDYTCPTGEKCCNNGYCLSCMRPIGGGGRPCVHKGQTYQDGESFMDECNTCDCIDGVAGCTRKACPGSKPGRCPRADGVDVGVGICVDMCTNDESCPRKQKCCSNGCGRTCQRPIKGRRCRYKGETYQDGTSFKDKCNTCNCNDGNVGCTKMACPGVSGRCPKPVPLVGGGVCVDTCTDDYSCPTLEKCCSNGNCRTCMKPVPGGRPCVHKGRTYQDGESFMDDCNTCRCNDGNAGCTRMACPGRPGTCPKLLGAGASVCVDTCDSDYTCPTGEKCCNNGYCLSCMRPIGGGGRSCVHKGQTYQDGESFMDDCNTCRCNDGNGGCTRMACPGRPGTCPALLGAGASVCVDSCDSDYTCPTGEKCCNNGYCLSCMRPIGGGGRSCVHKGRTYQDGESFMDDCNTCRCNDGNAGCTRMACPGRPGTCPALLGAGASVCVDSCDSDYTCPTGEKCCNNGYCLSCMRPIGGGGRSCVHKGRTYQDGERFMDDCNTCRCNDGNAGCTRMACPGRPGTCPKLLGAGASVCVDSCDSDYTCPTGEKCCNNGYCLSCMRPIGGGGRSCVHKGQTYQDGESFMDDCNTCRCNDGNAGCTRKACPGSKPGRCPRADGIGICVDMCTNDESCPRRQKCCSNGCGRTCQRPVRGRRCRYKGETYQDGTSFKDECNTCNCNDGNVGCTKMACPSRPGTCPAPRGNGGAMCLATCTDDYSCPKGEKCCFDGFCKTCMRPIDGGIPCVHNGRTYRDGETFMIDCNTCRCSNGNSACTLMACPKKHCIYNGNTYRDGETFKDDCNTCVCRDGNADCTMKTCPDDKPGQCPPPMSVGNCVHRCTTDLSCPGREKCCSNGCGTLCLPPTNGGGRPCYYNGRSYINGERFRDDCNTCTCSDGKVDCTLMACPGRPCRYNGVLYKDGEQFKKDCNTCTCSDGQAACTTMACYDERPGQCPPPVGTGNCVHRCTTDLSCPKGEKCCSNGCGTVCIPPVIGGGCIHNGVSYREGETFKDECNTCRCSGGKAACTLMSCPSDKHGTCPAPTGDGSYCVDECADDSGCTGVQKCCSNGCARVCMIPENAGKPCLQNGVNYKHGETFKDDCNTCTCRNGLVACTLMACPPKRPCYHGGVIRRDGESFKDDCNTCACMNGRVACTYMACGKACVYRGKTYQDGEGFKDDCNTCICRNETIACTLLDCSGIKQGSCPRRRPFQRCNNRCHNDKSCPGNEKCCSNWCGYTCMEPVGGDNCAGAVCAPLECTAPNRPYTVPGFCCPVCRPPIGTKPGSCPRRPSSWLCLDLCRTDFSCPGQQKCCSHRCGKSCVRPRFDRCDGVSCPPLRCMRQFRPPGRCCPVCRRRPRRE